MRTTQQTAELEPIERASEDELRALQLERLKWSVRHAYEHVASYRAKCEQAGVHPQDVRTLDDLGHFPFTVKDDMRAGYPFGLLAVPLDACRRTSCSRGTARSPNG